MNKLISTVIGYEVPNGTIIPDHDMIGLNRGVPELLPNEFRLLDGRIKLCNTMPKVLLASMVIRYDSEVLSNKDAKNLISELQRNLKSIMNDYLISHSIQYLEL